MESFNKHLRETLKDHQPMNTFMRRLRKVVSRYQKELILTLNQVGNNRSIISTRQRNRLFHVHRIRASILNDPNPDSLGYLDQLSTNLSASSEAVMKRNITQPVGLIYPMPLAAPVVGDNTSLATQPTISIDGNNSNTVDTAPPIVIDLISEQHHSITPFELIEDGVTAEESIAESNIEEFYADFNHFQDRVAIEHIHQHNPTLLVSQNSGAINMVRKDFRCTSTGDRLVSVQKFFKDEMNTIFDLVLGITVIHEDDHINNPNASAGLDGGGLTRQLTADIMEEISKSEMLFGNGSRKVPRSMYVNDVEFWEFVGKFFLFCILHRGDMPYWFAPIILEIIFTIDEDEDVQDKLDQEWIENISCDDVKSLGGMCSWLVGADLQEENDTWKDCLRTLGEDTVDSYDEILREANEAPEDPSDPAYLERQVSYQIQAKNIWVRKYFTQLLPAVKTIRSVFKMYGNDLLTKGFLHTIDYDLIKILITPCQSAATLIKSITISSCMSNPSDEWILAGLWQVMKEALSRFAIEKDFEDLMLLFSGSRRAILERKIILQLHHQPEALIKINTCSVTISLGEKRYLPENYINLIRVQRQYHHANIDFSSNIEFQIGVNKLKEDLDTSLAQTKHNSGFEYA